MALPPDSAESFVREVDENLRRDQQADFFKKHGTKIALAVGLFLLAVGGFLWWQSHRKDTASQESEQMSAALDQVGNGNVKGASEALVPLSDSSIDATKASALLTRAAIALRQNDRAGAVALYKQVSDDSGLPQAYRDLATVRGVAVEYDQIPPDQVISRLAPLAVAGHPFFGTAGEMTAMAMLAKGDRNGAGQLFAKIAADQQVPEPIRTRAVQIAGSLGVDASASLPGDPSAIPGL